MKILKMRAFDGSYVPFIQDEMGSISITSVSLPPDVRIDISECNGGLRLRLGGHLSTRFVLIPEVSNSILVGATSVYGDIKEKKFREKWEIVK